MPKFVKSQEELLLMAALNDPWLKNSFFCRVAVYKIFKYEGFINGDFYIYIIMDWCFSCVFYLHIKNTGVYIGSYSVWVSQLYMFW
jgi:hypothetical protein